MIQHFAYELDEIDLPLTVDQEVERYNFETSSISFEGRTWHLSQLTLMTSFVGDMEELI